VPFSEFRDWLEELHASARFGAGDRAGTANLIDAAARARGVASLTTAEPVSLARSLPPDPAVAGDKPGLTMEVELEFLADPVAMATDHVEIDCHGLHSTHVDALNHMGRNRTWYGGFAVDDPNGPSMADLVDAGLVTRGVFADIAAARGTDWVDPQVPVGGDDIDAALAGAGVDFAPGDALLLRMGRDAWEAAGNVYTSMGGDPPPPGIGLGGAEWIADHGVSIVGWDFLDSGHSAEPPGSVHMLIWAIGLGLIDNCDFAAARTALAAAGKATGLLVVAPLRIPGATGCTVNPLLLV
jgi:kynurenine formamidase